MAELARKTPATLQDFMDKAEEFINQEEAFKGDKESRDEQTKEPKGGRRDLRIREEGDEKSKEAKQVEKRKLLTEQEFNFTPLNTNIAEILLHIQDDPAIKWPQRMRAPVERRNMNKYCDFQQDHGHDTNNCVLLRLEIERHIKNRNWPNSQPSIGVSKALLTRSNMTIGRASIAIGDTTTKGVKINETMITGQTATDKPNEGTEMIEITVVQSE